MNQALYAHMNNKRKMKKKKKKIKWCHPSASAETLCQASCCPGP
jgi:hypothetical protein